MPALAPNEKHTAIGPSSHACTVTRVAVAIAMLNMASIR
jgi:hypothetical protein